MFLLYLAGFAWGLGQVVRYWWLTHRCWTAAQLADAEIEGARLWREIRWD